MTALTEFDRLEASAQWRPSDNEHSRDVVVSLGDATLAIYTIDETPLAHWSLPAIERRNPGEMPAIFAPGPDATETLEIEDELMLNAIERVDRAIRRGRSRPGILRTGLFTAALLLIGVLGVFWLPGAMIAHAVAVAPPAVRADTGARILDEITRSTGPVCRDPAARGALDGLSRRLIGEGRGRIVVLQSGVSGAVALPGGIVAVDRHLIEDHDEPAVLAGHVLAALDRAQHNDPIARLLNASGPAAALRLMTTGEVSQADLRAHAVRLLTQDPAPLQPGRLLARFETSGISTVPYATSLPEGDEIAQALIDGDPVGSDGRLILSDAAWVSLQTICVQ